MTHARSLLLNIAFLAAVLLFVFAIGQSIWYDAIIIEQPSMPEAVAKRGWTSDEFARGLGDFVSEIQREATTIHPRAEFGLKQQTLEFVLPGQLISIQTIAAALRSLFDRPSRRLVTSVVELDEHFDTSDCFGFSAESSTTRFLLRGRIAPEGAAWSVCGATLDELLRPGAEKVILETTPYVLASYLYRRNGDRAGRITEQILRDGPEHQRPWALNLQGLMLYDSGHYDEATKKFELATNQKKDLFFVYMNWGEALTKLGQEEDAIAKYKEAIALNPKSYECYHNWGVALMRLDRVEEAITKYKEAIRLNPQSYETYSSLSEALSSLGRDEEAKDVLEKGEATQESVR